MRVKHQSTGRIIMWRIGLQNPPWIPIDGEDAPESPASSSLKVDSLEVPDGTVQEVLAWAGDDPARRRAAVVAEKAGKQRKTILGL